ncbi:hypothetical protein [Nocardia fluminea]|uniref:hypothetical protein n=1 Tax=Nocardia fluminea TaxID=134984 RepID=UPI00344433AC
MVGVEVGVRVCGVVRAGLVVGGVELGRLSGLVPARDSDTAGGVVGLDGDEVWSIGGAVRGVEVEVTGAGVVAVGVVDLGDDGGEVGVGLIAGAGMDVGGAVGGGVDVVGVVVGVGFVT